MKFLRACFRSNLGSELCWAEVPSTDIENLKSRSYRGNKFFNAAPPSTIFMAVSNEKLIASMLFAILLFRVKLFGMFIMACHFHIFSFSSFLIKYCWTFFVNWVKWRFSILGDQSCLTKKYSVLTRIARILTWSLLTLTFQFTLGEEFIFEIDGINVNSRLVHVHSKRHDNPSFSLIRTFH